MISPSANPCAFPDEFIVALLYRRFLQELETIYAVKRPGTVWEQRLLHEAATASAPALRRRQMPSLPPLEKANSSGAS
ncbi:MAG TPA: hypothetical protein VEI25_05970 [Paraburkholderia sp.]|nr:hypothetical protein [Paraburkholderia sp.]